jgi:hypothetical protein
VTALVCTAAILLGQPCARGGAAIPVPPARGGQALVLEPVGDVDAWACIHSGVQPDGRRVGWGEAAWNATGGTYWGGLQMDVSFMLAYGRDMVRRYGGWANRWTPRDQMVVAERARRSGRGYYPWPQTARACGLI